jgi:hypothetical protein
MKWAFSVQWALFIRQEQSVRSVFVQENLYIGMQMDNKGQL